MDSGRVASNDEILENRDSKATVYKLDTPCRNGFRFNLLALSTTELSHAEPFTNSNVTGVKGLRVLLKLRLCWRHGHMNSYITRKTSASKMIGPVPC